MDARARHRCQAAGIAPLLEKDARALVGRRAGATENADAAPVNTPSRPSHATACDDRMLNAERGGRPRDATKYIPFSDLRFYRSKYFPRWQVAGEEMPASSTGSTASVGCNRCLRITAETLSSLLLLSSLALTVPSQAASAAATRARHLAQPSGRAASPGCVARGCPAATVLLATRDNVSCPHTFAVSSHSVLSCSTSGGKAARRRRTMCQDTFT